MRPIIFALPGNENFAKCLAEKTNAESGEAVIRQFPDGETYIRLQSDVKNKKIILVCTLDHPNSKLLPLHFFSKTLRSLGAAHICLVAPYLSYMRQDKIFNQGEGMTSEYFAGIISALADSLITVDPHLHRRNSMSEIYSIPCKVLHASQLISSYIKKHIIHPVLIGPDSESEQWVSEVAKNADAPFIVLEKTRLGDNDVKISVPHVEKFNTHTPVLVDDIISTAKTMVETISHLKKAGMAAPVCIGVHPIFAGNAFEDLQKAGAKNIVSSNTISHSSNMIDLTDLIAENI